MKDVKFFNFIGGKLTPTPLPAVLAGKGFGAVVALLVGAFVLACAFVACDVETALTEVGAGEEKDQLIEETGYYLVELWGSDGGSISIKDPEGNEKVGKGGKGAYVKAYVYFNEGDIIHLTVGGLSKVSDLGGGGGVNATGGAAAVNQYSTAGGGAADIRFDFNGDGKYTLDERILIAAGGGGASDGQHCGVKLNDRENCYEVFDGGYGGALTGGDGDGYKGAATYKYRWVNNGLTENRAFTTGSAIGKGATQSAGGAAGAPGGQAGSLGQGGKFANVVAESTGGGGGGLFGGGSGGHYDFNGAGGGGSSYVAGLQGYAAIPAVQSTWAGKAENKDKKLIVLGKGDAYNPVVKAGNAADLPANPGADKGGWCKITHIYEDSLITALGGMQTPAAK